MIRSSTNGPGKAGDVTLHATTLTLEEAGIVTDALDAGDGGNIVIEADQVRLLGDAAISSATHVTGNAGNVTIRAITLTLEGTFSLFNLLIPAIRAETTGNGEDAGDGGNIVIEADQVRLLGMQISSGTSGPGKAGNVTIRVTTLTLLEGASISTDSTGEEASASDGGNIVIEADQVRLDGARITSDTIGPGNAGNVTIRATTLTLLEGTSISTVARGREEDVGDGGNIVIEADQVRLLDGARISSETRGPGRGGTVTVTATDAVTISGSGSALTTRATGSGDGGGIVLSANIIELQDGAEITATSKFSSAGDITLTAKDSFRSDNGLVVTEASTADGGTIALRAQNRIRLHNSELSASVGGGEGTTGGNLRVEADFIIASDSRIVADAREGQGGNIDLVARQLVLVDPQSVVDASSRLGIDGEVDIQAPVTNLSGVVTPLSSTVESETSLVHDPCAERVQGKGVSRFVLRGRDQVPIEPHGVLPSPAYAADSGGRAPSCRRLMGNRRIRAHNRACSWPVLLPCPLVMHVRDGIAHKLGTRGKPDDGLDH
ncbi:hypothetical protein C2W62_16545 [Candidatus Entotheonella serta]|nr:hypothetical protein C2W62_16545 [Candidatus Entotheonella serta]